MLKKRVFCSTSIILAICMTLMVSAYAAPQQNQNSNFDNMNQNQNQNQNQNRNQNSGYGKQANYVINQGIFSGDGKGNYSLENYVKRGDIIIMIVKAFKLSTTVGDNFHDVSANSYYYNAIATAKSLGVAKGDGTNFKPESFVTIQQAISLVENATSVANSNVELDTTVDLDDLYNEDDLSRYATREDIANMLYYILTGDTTEEETYDLGAIKYTTDEDTAITLDADDFSETFEDTTTNDDLSYVEFTLPSSSYGKLYYNYESSSSYDSLVAAATKYYVDPDDGSDISEITFVPYSNYAGTVSIAYTAYDEDGDSYTGTIKIVVEEEDDITIGAIKYTTDEDTAITLDEDDFSEAFEDATGDDLSYVKFTLPSSSYGKLYYDYESSSDYDSLVTAATKYYADSADGSDISEVTFVPYSNYAGTVSITYTAYDEDGNSYAGIMKIVVEEEDDITIGTIKYTTDEDTEITLDEDDFSEAFEDATGDDLSYIKITPPSSSYGILYYDYESEDEYDSLVKVTTKYYADSSDGSEISEVTFVPHSNYNGTVSIGYTAYDDDGDSYTGTIKIVVDEDDDISIDTFKYTTDEDTEITLDEDDFSEAFEDATGDDLSYVKFTLPSSSYGKLYYDYESSSSYDSLVKAATKYYANSDDGSEISEVTFVPYSNYNGTVSIKYTAYDEDGNSYAGIMKIVVEED